MISLIGCAACGYARASSDPAAKTSQAGRSVESQDYEIRACGEDLGVNLLEVYCDNDASASERARKPRDDWARLLADVGAGRYRLIILWDCSRGSRDLLDWVAFLKLLKDQRVLVHLITHDRTYNPSNSRDWKILVQEGVEAHSQADTIAENASRGNRRARMKGRPHGHAPFGWKRVYDRESGKMVSQVPVDGEIEQVQEMFSRFVAGEKRGSIAQDLNERALLPEGDPMRAYRTRAGGLWRHDNVGHLLESPTHIGKIRDPESGDLLEGNWDGAVDEDLWWTAQAILKEKASRPSGRKYLLTNIARCGVCDSRMAVQSQKRITVLACRGVDDHGNVDGRGVGHTSIRMDWVDTHVVSMLLPRLCDPELLERLTAGASQRQAEARSEAQRLTVQLAEFKAKVIAREPGYTPDMYAEMEAAWTPQIQQLNAEATQGLDAGRLLALGFRQFADDSGFTGAELVGLVREAWNETPLEGKRALVRMFISSIVVMPRSRRGKNFDPSRVVIDGVPGV